MNDKLKQLFKQAEQWPEEAQNELANAAFEIAASLDGEYHATPEELAGIDRGLDDGRKGRFATAAVVRAVLRKFHRT